MYMITTLQFLSCELCLQSEVIEQKEDMINCLQEELIKVSSNVSSQSNQVIYWVVF
jgi:hypothetical protein